MNNYYNQNNVTERQTLFEEVNYYKIILYHGTTSTFRDAIEEDGLQPNNVSGKQNIKHSRPGLVYVGVPEVAIQYAGNACKHHGGEPILLEATLFTEDLVPDQDSGLKPCKDIIKYYPFDKDCTPGWLRSMSRIGTCANEGGIKSRNIDVYSSERDFEILVRKIKDLRQGLISAPTDYRIDNPIRL